MQSNNDEEQVLDRDFSPVPQVTEHDVQLAQDDQWPLESCPTNRL